MLKTLSISVGGVITLPSLMQILVSCEAQKELEWKPVFFDRTQGFIVENLVKIILPRGKNIGAVDVNAPQFIDFILKDIIPEKVNSAIVKGGVIFQEKFETMFHKKVLEGTKDEFLELLSIYFKIPPDQQKKIFKIIQKEADKVENEELYYIYKYLTFIRTYSLFGYYNSKVVGTEILNYNPVPGTYEACIDVSVVGNSSSI